MILDIVASEGRVLLMQAQRRVNVLNADESKSRLDASCVTYLSTAGLRVLLHLWQELGKENRTLHIRALRPYIQELFEIIGFNQIIPNHTDVAAAMSAVGGRT